ncbi:MAG: hypothetical protein ACI8Y4_004204 [Candidatus Poriferisodalaceae bacterium]
MVIAVTVIIAVIIGFVIAAGVIGRESRRLGGQRREPVWRLEEAAMFVEEGIDFDVAARLDPAALRQLLRWHLNALQYEREQGTPTVSTDGDAISDLYRQARGEGFEISRPEVDAVIRGHLAYLAKIGAIGVAEESAEA